MIMKKNTNIKYSPVDKLRTLAALSVIDQRIPQDLELITRSTVFRWRNCSDIKRDKEKKSNPMSATSMGAIASNSKIRKDMETFALLTSVYQHGPANIFDSFTPSSPPNEFDLVSEIWRRDAVDYEYLHEIHECKQMSKLISTLIERMIFPAEEEYLLILSWVTSLWIWQGKLNNQPCFEVEIVNISNILVDLVVKCKKILAACYISPAIFIYYLTQQANKISGFSDVAVMAIQMAAEKSIEDAVVEVHP